MDAVIKFANGNGISGTPTLVLTDGRIVVGMRGAETLKKYSEVMTNLDYLPDKVLQKEELR
ncbi:MAG TPA: hypothetical protein VHN12_09550 [Geobacteraceae bacterium]|nr:hypothetical protein [Geobacteraceae bacterium]